MSNNVTFTPDSIMTDGQYKGLLCIIRGTLACLGVAANIINVISFVSMGPQDGITVCFLSLAVSDLSFLVAVIVIATPSDFMVVDTLTELCIWFPLEPYGVSINLVHGGRIPYFMSNINTAFLNVVKCLCVGKTLMFKNFFGTRITLLASAVSEVLFVVSYLDVLVYMGMMPQDVPRRNAVRPTLWSFTKREEVKDLVWGMRNVFIPLATQIIIKIFLAVMKTSLRAAKQFCRTYTRHSYPRSERILTTTRESDEASQGEIKGVSGKDLQIIKQVVLIYTVYVVCNTPTILINFTDAYEPQFSIEETYRNLYLTVNGVQLPCQTINVSFNIFIYSKFNYKY